MSVHMITGHLGYAHVQPQDEANMNNRMIGEGRFTFNSSMSYKKTNNVLSITAKGLMIDGRRFDIDAENVTITTGTAGLYRKDRVVLTYTMNMEDADKMGVESAYLEVIRGTPANSKASAVLPAYVDAAIDSVNTFAQIPLYNVEINETTIENITSLIGSKNITMEQARGHIADKNIHITSTERTNWNDANSKKHTHSNKSIIDKINQTLLDNWSAAYTHISDAVKHITADERTKWNQAASPVDNLNETTTGKSLDAHQGYVLNEAISTNSYGEYAGGKNLFDAEDFCASNSNSIYSYVGNGGIKVIGTDTSGHASYKYDVFIPKGTYTFSGYGREFRGYDVTKDVDYGNATETVTITFDTDTIFRLKFIVDTLNTVIYPQIELGTTATPYKPYIKSNYQLGNDVDGITDGLGDFGLDNKFDGELVQGFISITDGTTFTGNNYVTSKNAIQCNANDVIEIKNTTTGRIVFFKSDGTYLSGTEFKTGIKAKAPENAKSFKFTIGYVTGITPTNAGHIGVYINQLSDKADKSEVCVNLLKPTLETTTNNGVTCTANGDGTYTLNGTASDSTTFELAINSHVTISDTCYLLGVPSTGISKGSATSSKWATIGGTFNSSNVVSTSDEKVVLQNGTLTRAYIWCAKGVSFENAVFKPMLTTDLTATYDDFVPYTGDKGRINEDVAELRDNTYYTSEEKCIGNLLGDQLYRVTFSKTYSSATAIATGVDVLLNGQGGLLEGNSTFNSIKDLVNVESFIETPTYKLTNYLAVKKDKTGYFYVRNIVDSVPATRLILTLYYTKN